MRTSKKGISLGYILLGIIVIAVIIVFASKVINKKENVNVNENVNEKIDLNVNTESPSNVTELKQGINFRINDISCIKGQEINIEIELLNDSDFVAANFEYKYDNNNLEYINYTVGSSFENAAMTVVNNDENNSKVLIGFVAKPEGEKKVKSGKIIDIKFRVKDNITTNQINNSFECTTLKNEIGTDLQYNIKQGIIKIE